MKKILFSYKMMLFLFFLLAAGAAVGTFIENDYGTQTARVLVYNNIWYEITMSLSIINLIGIMVRHKMWKNSAKFIFHASFVMILLGAALTRYVGFEGIMHIREGQTTNKMISLEPYLQVTIIDNGQIYYKEYQKNFSAIGSNNYNYTIKFDGKSLNISSNSYIHSKKGNAEMSIVNANVTYNGVTKVVKLIGQRGMKGVGSQINFGKLKVYMEYGSKSLTLPFEIKLRDFQLERYPGSMAPSSYASEVTLIDKANHKKFDFRIYMNHILKYGTYRFYQSSYDQDEKGTILSVNNDPGKWPTYIGYLMLAIGLLMNMFDKKSRFMKLTRYIKQYNSLILVALFSIFINTNLNAQTNINSTVDYLNSYKKDSLQTAIKFSKLVNQGGMGRMQPLDSLDINILHKLSRKSSLMGMNANQVVMGMLARPTIWRDVKMISIRTPKLKKLLGISKDRKLIAFSEAFKGDQYLLKKYVEKANATPPNKRGTFENDLIKVDERLNIAYMVYYGDIFKIFPKVNDPSHKWYNPLEAIQTFPKQQKEYVQTMIGGLIDSLAHSDYQKANKAIDLISLYQRKIGANIIPSQSKIDNEILFNKLDIFPKITLAYVLLGLIMFFVAFLTVFNKNFQSNKINTVFFIILALLFAAQTFGMGMRWYISGHAPWSNTYESLVYIAWSTMFAGIIFFRKSLMALSATVVMAGIFMFTAHLSGIDPQITNLVPVLKSYWLTIHVSIITGSYGFLGLGAMLGFMSMLLFIFRDPNKPNIDKTINQITAINEAALIIGIAMLVVGNFIGGVWANESWGRYWGWDPKETWAWVSIIVYAFVIHLRLVPKWNTPFILSATSTVAFFSILMTYFGVNFYLSGMHSYATGDPVPIPMWVYISTSTVFIVIALASRKRNLAKLKV